MKRMKLNHRNESKARFLSNEFPTITGTKSRAPPATPEYEPAPGPSKVLLRQFRKNIRLDL